MYLKCDLLVEVFGCELDWKLAVRANKGKVLEIMRKGFDEIVKECGGGVSVD